MPETKEVCLAFKETAEIGDVIFVLNAMGMTTSDENLIEILKRNKNIVLRDEQREG
jgi:hypothetical protein